MSELDLPESWARAKIGNISERKGGGTPSRKNPEFFNGKTPWITVADIPREQSNIFSISTARECITTAAIEYSSTQLIPAGSVILSTRVSVGKVGINAVAICTNQDFCSFTKINVDSRFFAQFLLSKKQHFLNESKGTTIKGISLPVVTEMEMPLPPIKEQQRIVTKIESCSSKIDATENALDEAEALLKIYRESLLAKALRGELVPQDPKDEPAVELLKRIRAGKAEQNRGKKRQQDELLPIAEEDIPFEIPKTWKWVRLSDIGEFQGGMTPSTTNPKFWDGEIPWVSPKDMKRRELSDAIDHISNAALKATRLARLPEGTLLFVVRGMILAHSFPVAITRAPLTINQDIKALVLRSIVNAEYILWAMTSAKKAFLETVKSSSHGTKRVEPGTLENWLVPMAPFNEQGRIVTALDAANTRCDRLSEEIQEIRTTSGLLRSTIMRSAFAGRLVPQILKEGTGHALLEQILKPKASEAESEPGSIRSPKRGLKGKKKHDQQRTTV